MKVKEVIKPFHIKLQEAQKDADQVLAHLKDTMPFGDKIIHHLCLSSVDDTKVEVQIGENEVVDVTKEVNEYLTLK